MKEPGTTTASSSSLTIADVERAFEAVRKVEEDHPRRFGLILSEHAPAWPVSFDPPGICLTEDLKGLEEFIVATPEWWKRTTGWDWKVGFYKV